MSQSPQQPPDLEQLKSWDSAAWLEVFPQLLGLARHVAREACYALTPEEIDEVASDAVRELLQQIHKAESFEQIKGLLAIIAQRRAVSLARRKFAAKRSAGMTDSLEALEEGSAGGVAVTDPSAAPWTDLEAAELLLLLNRILSGLDGLGRNLVMDQTIGGLSHKELAQKYGLPMGTVASTLARTLNQIRQGLQKSPGLREELSAFLR